MAFPVAFDTCALYGASLCDTLLTLAELNAYRPLWSTDILDELQRNLAERVGPEAAARRVSAMRAAFPDAEVEDYSDLVQAMTCDPKDRHVLAAAVRGHAEVLVTFNTKDFPETACSPHSIKVIHPDDFLLDQLDLYPGRVGDALLLQVESKQRPQLTLPVLLKALANCGVGNFASEAMRRDFTRTIQM